MAKLSNIRLLVCAVIAGSALLSACASEPVVAPRRSGLQGDNVRAVDFSGSWELDYSQSDNVQQKVDSMVRELNRETERRAQGGMQQGQLGGIGMGGFGATSGEAILGMVRMADMITQSTLLEVTQDPHKIRVKREGDFDLTCEFYPGEMHSVETPFGTEVCGWNGHQLVFKLLLPGGLGIQHVMTMGAAGQKLNIATTVMTDQVSFPFVLNRVYNHFVPGESGYSCKMTLTKGTVCTTGSK